MNGLEALIPIAMFATLVYAIKIVSDNRLRRLLIERGKVDENIPYLFKNYSSENPLTSVKWGLVLVGIGLAFLLRLFFPDSMSDEALIGMIFLFAGIGFLIYYFLATRQGNTPPATTE